MHNLDLERLINRKLNASRFQDYGPNGLQVEGRTHVQRIITGVTACQALLEVALKKQADAIIVHHGYFWKNEAQAVYGMKRNRLKTLLTNDINLYGYHLPLDAHPVLGNNAQLAKLLSIRVIGKVEPMVLHGEFDQKLTGTALKQRIENCLGSSVLHCGDNAPVHIRHVAWCTGGGVSFIDRVVRFGVDAFISGDISEQSIHSAREMGVHLFSAGHHATERGGVKALGEWLAQQHGFIVTFIDIPNPV